MEERGLFIERTGVMLEFIGIPRVAGRVLGALLIAPPEGHTASELAGLLHASRAGISTGTTYLTRVGLIERAPRPGERADRFRMRPHAWATLMEQGNRRLGTLHDLAVEGQRILPPGADPGPLREMEEFFALWLRLYPDILRRWHAAERASTGGES
ncbi:transcriptional regulator, MarR family [Deinococcus aerius]|uniref:Transcriptional regulator, MarR family n=1 Tax=Deinococcus aerius TaxID=200253 RepID=A0A2I9DFW9_9DEIO|nr:MarR family transcriptional regulator [Deinococcus aerius]GBF04988.1 transcriptional regulator, MarR family [Deinococcus aerius]